MVTVHRAVSARMKKKKKDLANCLTNTKSSVILVTIRKGVKTTTQGWCDGMPRDSQVLGRHVVQKFLSCFDEIQAQADPQPLHE